MKPKHKDTNDLIPNNFFPVYIGGLALYHRPGLKQLQSFKANTPCTAVFTLQSPQECPLEVSQYCKKLQLNWHWVNLRGANQTLLKSSETATKLKEGLATAKVLLESGEFILIHCAAGIHRTGLFAYALLRICDFNEELAHNAIKAMRTATFEKCGERRFAIAEGVALEMLGKATSSVDGCRAGRIGECLPEGLFWLNLTVNCEGNIEFSYLATDSALDLCVKGGGGLLLMPIKQVVKSLGRHWVELQNGQLGSARKKYKVKQAGSEIEGFVQRSFAKKPVLAGKHLFLAMQFMKEYWPGLLECFTGRYIELNSVENLVEVRFGNSIEEWVTGLKQVRNHN